MFKTSASIVFRLVCLGALLCAAGRAQPAPRTLSDGDRTVADLAGLEVSARILTTDARGNAVAVSRHAVFKAGPDGAGRSEALLEFEPRGRLDLSVQAGRGQPEGTLRLAVEAVASGPGWAGARLERLSLVLPLQLDHRKRVLQAGEQGLGWETRAAYQFHTPAHGTTQISDLPDTNLWTLFRSDWSSGDTYTLARWESERTAPLVMHRGTGFPGWLAVYDRKGGIAVGLDEPHFVNPRALEVRTAGGGAVAIDLHPASDEPRPLQTTEGYFQDSLAVKLSAFSGAPDKTGLAVARLPAVSGPPSAARASAGPSALLPVFGGVPFAPGSLRPGETVELRDAAHRAVPVQTAPLGFWPDGSIKWLELVFPRDPASPAPATSLPENGSPLPGFQLTYGSGQAEAYTLAKKTVPPAAAKTGPDKLTVTREGDAVRVRTGRLEAVFAPGVRWWRELAVDGRSLLAPGGTINAYLETTTLDTAPEPDARTLTGGIREASVLAADKIEVEETGPVRTVVKIEGRTQGVSPCRIVVRLEFYAGSPAIRGWHTVEVGNFDPRRVFITGLGLELPLALEAAAARATVTRDGRPLETGAADGVSLRAVHPDVSELSALSADGVLRPVATGPGLEGALAVRTPALGVSAVFRDFRNLFPSQIAVRRRGNGLVLDLGFWPRDTAPLDFRRYSNFPHRGQSETITGTGADWVDQVYYEQEPVHGISRTHEFLLVPEAGGPAAPLPALAAALEDRPLIYSGEKTYLATGVLADDLGDPSFAPVRATLEQFADFLAFHRRKWRWQGKWVYGDIQHSFQRGYGRIVDPATLAQVLAAGETRLPKNKTVGDYRTQNDWAFDNGRWGWTNTEGLPNRFLGELYLRTGRRDLFFAVEALAAETRDVVVRHAGRWFGAGTRHGVQPWSDGGHQSRMTIPSEYRLHRLLTGDKRSRDVLLRYGRDVFLQPKSTFVQGTAPLVRDNVDHSTRLYGLLTLWEATGDPGVGAALARYVKLFIVPGGLATEPVVKFPEIEAAAAPRDLNSGNMFFQTFGAMYALTEYHALTGDPALETAIIQMAAAGLDDPQSFRVLADNAPNSAYFFWPALAFAARHGAHPERFREFIRTWAAGPGAETMHQLVTRNPQHWTGPTGFMYGGAMSGTLFRANTLPAIAAALGTLPKPEPRYAEEIAALERKGASRPPSNLSWQDEYDRPEFQAFLGRWLPWSAAPETGAAPSPEKSK